jgi:hypothetical protein
VFWNQGRIASAIRGFEEGVLLPKCAYVVAKYLRRDKSQHADTQNFLIRWLIRNGIIDSLQLSLDDEGNFLYNAAPNLSTLI